MKRNKRKQEGKKVAAALISLVLVVALVISLLGSMLLY